MIEVSIDIFILYFGKFYYIEKQFSFDEIHMFYKRNMHHLVVIYFSEILTLITKRHTKSSFHYIIGLHNMHSKNYYTD